MVGTIVNTDDFPTELRVYRVGNDSTAREDADLIIPAEDLTNTSKSSIEITRRIQEWKDKATLGIKRWSVNGSQDYLGEITSGDRIEYWASWLVGSEPEAGGYGTGGYGVGGYGGGPAVYSERRWTGYAFAPTRTGHGRDHVTLEFDATDFVFEVLSSRIVTNSWEDTLIAGSSDAIVNSIVEGNCPEIDRSGIEDVGVSTDREFDARDCKEALSDLAETADALMASDGTTLIYKSWGDLSIKHTLEWSDVLGEVEVKVDDTDLVNDWRVDGGIGTELDEAQETVSSYTYVDEDNPLVYQLDPAKNRLDRADIYTKKGSEDDLRVRVQAPNSGGTGPRDATETTKDILSTSSSHEFISEDGWREHFKWSRDPLPDDPWLIIDSNGSGGHEIGVDGNGNPAHRTYYPYKVAVRVDSKDSIDSDRLRQDRIKKKILSSFDAARDVGEAKLRHSVEPSETLSCEADSPRAHKLAPGDVVDARLDSIDATGEWVVIERSETYDASTNTLRTELTLQNLDTV